MTAVHVRLAGVHEVRICASCGPSREKDGARGGLRGAQQEGDLSLSLCLSPGRSWRSGDAQIPPLVRNHRRDDTPGFLGPAMPHHDCICRLERYVLRRI